MLYLFKHWYYEVTVTLTLWSMWWSRVSAWNYWLNPCLFTSILDILLSSNASSVALTTLNGLVFHMVCGFAWNAQESIEVWVSISGMSEIIMLSNFFIKFTPSNTCTVLTCDLHVIAKVKVVCFVECLRVDKWFFPCLLAS